MDSPALNELARRNGGGSLKAQAGFTVEAALGAVAKSLARQDRHTRELAAAVHTVPVRTAALTGLVSASGVLDFPDQLGPHDGYWWDVKRLSAWGWTAGTVTIYQNDSTGAGEQLAVFTTPGQYTWGKAQMPLAPRDRLVVVAAGVTGAVYIGGAATEVLAPFWPEYVL